MPDNRPQEKQAAETEAAVPGWRRAAALFALPPEALSEPVRIALDILTAEIDALREEAAELRARLEAAEAVAVHDPLVDVLNRRGLFREAARLVSMVSRHELRASLIYFDLDGFKAVNDRHGHAAGDLVLRKTAACLVAHTRASDVVARIGGDEFVAILTHLDPEAAELKAAHLCERIAAIRLPGAAADVRISASCGVYSFRPGDGLEHALAAADEAMYARRARKRG
jgi:diguanylate cyclase (GGDEF)-like protein